MADSSLNMRFKAKGMELSSALKEYFIGKIDKLEHKGLVEWIDVEFGQTIAHRGVADDFYVRVLLKMPKAYVRVKKSGDDIYALVDEVVDILVQKVNQYFSKLAEQPKVPEKLIVLQDQEDFSNDVAKYLDYEVRVRRKELKEMAPMTVQEAVVHLELLGLPAFIFRNVEDGNSVQMLYKDGTEYVLVVPPKV